MKTKIVYSVMAEHHVFIQYLLQYNKTADGILTINEINLLENVILYQFYTTSDQILLNRIRKKYLHLY